MDVERDAGGAAALTPMVGAGERLDAKPLPGPTADATMILTEALEDRRVRTAGDTTDERGARHGAKCSVRALPLLSVARKGRTRLRVYAETRAVSGWITRQTSASSTSGASSTW
jgi:hypothetical protein